MMDWIFMLFCLALTIGALELMTGFGLFDIRRQHRTMSEIISRSTRGEKERYKISEDHRKFILLYILIAILIFVALALYSGRK